MSWGARRILLKLSPQPENEDIDTSVKNFFITHPADGEKLLAGQDQSRRSEEGAEEIEFAAGEFDLPVLGVNQPAQPHIQRPFQKLIDPAFFLCRGCQPLSKRHTYPLSSLPSASASCLHFAHLSWAEFGIS
jgi:hypothetical protein